jgi:hypothetical protein
LPLNFHFQPNIGERKSIGNSEMMEREWPPNGTRISHRQAKRSEAKPVGRMRWLGALQVLLQHRPPT